MAISRTCRLLSVLVPLLLIVTPLTAVEPSADELTFFEGKVRPLLTKHCYSCHSTESSKVKGGLLLDSKEGWMAGGDSGDVIELGKPDESRLIESVRYENSDLQMPPKYKLSDAEISVLETWIEMNAPDPRTEPSATKAAGIDWQRGREHWSFQPVSNPAPPTVKTEGWARDDLDRFILSKLESEGLDPVPDADRFALIRRITLDLTGLPPTVADVTAFVADPASDDEALTNVVDRLLKSPAFGERWGRYWLDVARYADSVGKTRNIPFPYAWRYRNYVIDSLNADKPYNEFLTEQIAGDSLAAKDALDREENLIATGLLALGSMDLNERDREQFQLDRIDDQMDTIGRATMGLTIACARCHDHKFDPISQADYYALAGIFASTTTMSGQQSRQGGSKEYFQPRLLVNLKSPTVATPVPTKRVPAEKAAQFKARLQQLRAKGVNELSQADRDELRRIRTKFAELRDANSTPAKGKSYGAVEAVVDPQAELVMAAIDGEVADLALRVRGEPDIRGDVIPRAFPVIFEESAAHEFSADSSGRRELANWLTSGQHPLTARVMVNRIWSHLFGRGLVETVDNFGASGAMPTHPELLDHLATRFVDNGWSTKSLIRSMVLSRTYRLSAQNVARNAAIDEDNRLHWRANLRRLEAEAIRDSLLASGGMLQSERPSGAPFSAPLNVDLSKANRKGRALDPIAEPVRSVYLPVFRSKLPGMFTVFDFAEPDQVNGQRDVTTVAPQALFLLNNPFVAEVADRAAGRILEQDASDDKARVHYAYVYTLSRYPTDDEQRRALSFLDGDKSRSDSWSMFIQALYSSAEFRYIP